MATALRNLLFEEVSVGAQGRLVRTAPEGAGSAWLLALLAELVDDELPGAGCRWLSQTLDFLEPPHAGAQIAATARVAARDSADRVLDLDCRCSDGADRLLLQGRIRVRPAKVRMEAPPRPAAALPTSEGGQQTPPERPRFLLDLAARAQACGRMRMGVVHPVDANALKGLIDAAAAGLIEPVLFGPRHRIDAAAAEAGLDISAFDRVDTEHSHAAAEAAVAAVRDGGLAGLMKGSLHTDELLGAIVDRREGLLTDRRISHAFCLDVPLYPRPLFVTDAAINIAPDLLQKRDITQNVIDLAHSVGIALPKIAILAAVETVTPRMTATLDAAALCKMAERGQITGGILDGPLAFDNAVSEAAARSKRIDSEVAGRADILVVPDIEAGNMVAKQLEYLAGAAPAGIVLGARVPVVLTSRADGPASRLASCALALLLAKARAEGLLAKPLA